MSKSPTYIVGDLFYIGGGIMAKNLVQPDYSHENVVHTAAYYLFGHNTHFHLA
jgi:hypothetical protein